MHERNHDSRNGDSFVLVETVDDHPGRRPAYVGTGRSGWLVHPYFCSSADPAWLRPDAVQHGFGLRGPRSGYALLCPEYTRRTAPVRSRERPTCRRDSVALVRGALSPAV